MAERIRFESRRVGAIEVAEADVVSFEPLPGFPKKTRFVIMEHAEESEMAWLVSIEDPDLALVVASPWAFFPNYDPPIGREHLAALGIEKVEDVEMLSVVTLSGKSINLNLAAPLLINASTRKGLQVVSDDPRYTTRAPIPALAEGKQEVSADRNDAAAGPSSSPASPA